MRIHSFAPIFAPDAKLLILGTMPSVQSLTDGFYYAHPRNAFWPILGEVFRAPVDGMNARISLVQNCQLALWDVAESCAREGSLDSAMRDIRPNDINSLVRGLSIEHILLNGQTAYRLFRHHFPALEQAMDCRILLSTSPAYTLPYEKKLAAWRDALCQAL